MRGSPLLRTLAVVAALLLAAFGIHRLSGTSDRPEIPASAPVEDPAPEVTPTPVFMTFSAVPERVRIEIEGRTLELRPEGTSAVGQLGLGGGSPVLFLTVDWPAGDETTPRFAKLTLEPPGRPTLTRVFDGFGTVEDVWELPAQP